MQYIRAFFFIFTSFLFSQESICYGTTSKGRLENGVALPSSGENYTSYSTMGELLGRTYVHSKVKEIIVASYRSLETSMPDKVYKYAETGFEEGGKFSPHKTHQNGLSVDFMVPVNDAEGKSVHLPTHPFNKFGYNIEFDKTGHYDEVTIDYEAMAAHIVSLHKEAKKRGARIWRIIFDPKLQHYLFKTKYGTYLRKHINFSEKRSWVRHDEHYHVDFIIPCKGI
ncbi:penicillin-insensitive murein endopeptidase [Sulfurovum sp. zt1-1]|uniref:Penicillin-insensitive murein endopeptidase n=1 Tax=Sulfurovum zhangzhouensis TaxID=3019067 RepID=A0ABT7QZR0_9BACT|nr:penicillin-insensitive murein endopeptidase [Sulfurovum zhangzhouensis]MDM5272330.1 penicillin-insensitive murein endopeptidase [Sulfurovum zhangzhouensis]